MPSRAIFDALRKDRRSSQQPGHDQEVADARRRIGEERRSDCKSGYRRAARAGARYSPHSPPTTRTDGGSIQSRGFAARIDSATGFWWPAAPSYAEQLDYARRFDAAYAAGGCAVQRLGRTAFSPLQNRLEECGHKPVESAQRPVSPLRLRLALRQGSVEGGKAAARTFRGRKRCARAEMYDRQIE